MLSSEADKITCDLQTQCRSIIWSNNIGILLNDSRTIHFEVNKHDFPENNVSDLKKQNTIKAIIDTGSELKDSFC